MRDHILSGHLEVKDEFGGIGTSNEQFDGNLRAKRINTDFNKSKITKDKNIKDKSENISNTVIGVVATGCSIKQK